MEELVEYLARGLVDEPDEVRVVRAERDGNVVLERLVLDTGGLKPSYLGPPETAQR